jgi:nucleoid DNA-binding protein
MRKPEIVESMARRAGVSPGEAADRLDRMVHDILVRLRRRGQARLGELGTFTVGDDGAIRFEKAARDE